MSRSRTTRRGQPVQRCSGQETTSRRRGAGLLIGCPSHGGGALPAAEALHTDADEPDLTAETMHQAAESRDERGMFTWDECRGERQLAEIAQASGQQVWVMDGNRVVGDAAAIDPDRIHL